MKSSALICVLTWLFFWRHVTINCYSAWSHQISIQSEIKLRKSMQTNQTIPFWLRMKCWMPFSIYTYQKHVCYPLKRLLFVTGNKFDGYSILLFSRINPFLEFRMRLFWFFFPHTIIHSISILQLWSRKSNILFNETTRDQFKAFSICIVMLQQNKDE